jgi:hypothetical protein
MRNAALYTAAVFFAAGAVGHLVRLTSGIELVVNGLAVPVWVSYPGVLVASALAVWMVVAARRS